ncbi:MAG: sigma-70 family RNA polymerase sigma factor [Planctomycetota bacterium]|nr:sigma-70 family RNA polymerase sigma factor [Planctomycetota bacterium]
MQPTPLAPRSLPKRPEAESAKDLLERLAPYPAVVRALRKRGARLAHETGDERRVLENHLATELMSLFQATGDKEAFEALYAFARGSVHDWILGLLRGSNGSVDPLEVLQDTFINVYKYNQSFRPDHDGSFRVWVRTIAGNLIRRAYSRRPTRRFEDMPEGLQEPADPRPGPSHLVQGIEDRAGLRRAYLLMLLHYADAYEELSDRDRHAMDLVEVEGMSYREAGAVLEVRASNMKMILFRARKRLVNHMRRSMGVLPRGFAGGAAPSEERIAS